MSTQLSLLQIRTFHFPHPRISLAFLFARSSLFVITRRGKGRARGSTHRLCFVLKEFVAPSALVSATFASQRGRVCWPCAPLTSRAYVAFYDLYFAIRIFNCLDLMGMKLIWHCEGKRVEEEVDRNEV